MMAPDWQEKADRDARKAVRKAYATGQTVCYSLQRLIELGLSLKVIRAVHNGSIKARPNMPDQKA